MKPAAFVYDPEQIAACGLFCGAYAAERHAAGQMTIHKKRKYRTF